ncbi:MAG: DUF1493 family protein [Balneolaceae bacterium]|nr:DUF1493 family protein [Balneolaceae bacterium]MBO6547132.1 DUF1493 family protein [Balneolaceae bacterium]MBO6647920.1 DUF1493 family protein [Balneolaceae bacterium]
METKLDKKVYNFVERRTGISRDNLNKETTLSKDLHIAGSEAIYFINEFSEEFDVDLAEFNFDDHFLPEANSLLLPITIPVYLFELIFKRNKKDPDDELIQISIKDLIYFAKTGRWMTLSPAPSK